MSFLAAALLVLAPTLDSPRADVAFPAQPAKAAQKITVTSAAEMKMTMSVKVGGQEVQKMELPSKEDVACAVTVSASDAKGASAAKLVFGKCPTIQPSPFGPQPKDHACSEQTYEMKRGEKGFAAATELEKDAKQMTGWICDMTLSAPLSAVLGGKTVKQGEAVEVPADAAHRALALFASDAEVKKMTLTLDGERKEGAVDVAVFKVVAKLAMPPSEENPGELSIDVAGELTIDKSTLLVATSALTGTVKLDASMDQGGQPMVMEGRGTSTWKYSSKAE